MLDVDIRIGPHVRYQTAFAELRDSLVHVELDLEDGTHTYTSPTFVIGALSAFETRPLLARITFGYKYDQDQHVVTVCGTDYDSADTLCLVSWPEGTSEYCYERTAVGGGFEADDLTRNSRWNYRTPLTHGLDGVLKRMARAANDALIAALEGIPDLNVRVRTNPPELAADC